MNLDSYQKVMLPAIEQEIKNNLKRIESAGMGDYTQMLAYHMGWEGKGAGQKAQGKRVRPLLVLLATAASGGDWQKALPAAAAVELIHNFSLLHDDIQDNSPFRRGRETVWKKWGVALAINAGDAMYSLAYLALEPLRERISPENALEAHSTLLNASIRLTKGQYLDISYEAREDITVEDYWPMIEGKTAALLSCCMELGALVANVSDGKRAAFAEFGRLLGLAFQAQDDMLGIWGDAAQTGKSTDSDLVSSKKTLPVLFGLAQGGDFAQRWQQGPILPEDTQNVMRMLEEEGAKAFIEEIANTLTYQSLEKLDEAATSGEAKEAIIELTRHLIKRNF